MHRIYWNFNKMKRLAAGVFLILFLIAVITNSQRGWRICKTTRTNECESETDVSYGGNKREGKETRRGISCRRNAVAFSKRWRRRGGGGSGADWVVPECEARAGVCGERYSAVATVCSRDRWALLNQRLRNVSAGLKLTPEPTNLSETLKTRVVVCG